MIRLKNIKQTFTSYEFIKPKFESYILKNFHAPNHNQPRCQVNAYGFYNIDFQ